MKKIALALSIVGIPSALLGGVVQDQPIIIKAKAIDRSLFTPLGAVIVRLANGEARTLSTGFLVSRCHALTTRRAFENDSTLVGRYVEYWANVVDDVNEWKGTLGQVVAEGTPNPNQAIGKNDWVLLRLEHCFGKKYGTIGFDLSPPDPSERYILASFPTGVRRLSLNIHPRCQIFGIERNIAAHTCVVGKGQAGSPIVRIVKEGGKKRLKLVGLLASDELPPQAIPNTRSRHFNRQTADKVVFASHLASDTKLRAALTSSKPFRSPSGIGLNSLIFR